MRGIRIAQRLLNRRLAQETDRVLAAYSDPIRQRRKRLAKELAHASTGDPASLVLGTTEWRQPVVLPVDKLAAHGLVLGASGAGKSYIALSLIRQLLSHPSLLDSVSFGILDAKGELFTLALTYLHAHLYGLGDAERAAIEKRIILIDFSDPNQISPYNVLARRPGLADELMIAERIDTISEQFSGLSELSVRMKMIAKYLFLLMTEFALPLPFFERLCIDPHLLNTLVEKSQNPQVRDYFQHRFDDESTSTLLALRQRIDALFVSEGVRLSLSAQSAPDFAALQDHGHIILINTAGRNITRSISELLQGLILSDIKQSVFRRSNHNRRFLWFFDEAQNLYKTSANREHMVDLLTMSRSFGSFFVLLTQSLTSAIRDADVLNSVLANVRWLVMLRSTLRDADLIAPAMPLTGALLKSRRHPLESVRYMSESEELRAQLKEIAKLPDRVAYCWLKAQMNTAVRITTPHVLPPHKIAHCTREELAAFMAAQQLGRGVPRAGILKQIDEQQQRLRSLLRPQESDRVLLDSEMERKQGQALVKMLEAEYANKR